MVEIPDNYLIVFIGAIFIPLFIFLMKMIMEQGNNRSKIDLMMKHIEESKEWVKCITNLDIETKLFKQRFENIEQDIKTLFRRDNNNKRSSNSLDNNTNNNNNNNA